MHALSSHPRPVGAARMVPLPTEMPSMWSSIWPFLLWGAWGLWTAISDLRGDDMTATLIRLFVGAGILGFFRPRVWWVWALALSAWVPLEPIVVSALSLTDVHRSALTGTIIPPIPALLGGVLGRTFARTL